MRFKQFVQLEDSLHVTFFIQFKLDVDMLRGDLHDYKTFINDEIL